MRLAFLGPPGAGKGTQAELFARRYGFAHISTGEILRDGVRGGTPLGSKARGYMDGGELVPDEIVVGIVAEKLEGIDGGFVLDGFPRTVEQAEALNGILRGRNGSLDAVIYFDVDEDTVVRRLSGRRVCGKCGWNYHVENMPPKREGVCDRCGGEVHQRDDDRPEVVRERLRVYQRETAPLIDYYKRKGLLERVAGDPPPEEVQEEVRRLFADRLGSRR